MKLTGLRPMLWTEDLKGSVDFYTNSLGFAADGTRREEKIRHEPATMFA